MYPQLWGPYLVCSQRYNKCLLNQRVTVIPISWLLPRNLLPWQTHRPCRRYPEQGDEGCKDIPRVFFMTTASWQVGDISTGVRHEWMTCWLWSGWASTANSLILSLQTCQSKLFLFPCESSRSVRGIGNGFGQPDPKCVQWCQGHHRIKKKYINLPRISSSETSSQPAQNTEWMGFLCLSSHSCLLKGSSSLGQLLGHLTGLLSEKSSILHCVSLPWPPPPGENLTLWIKHCNNLNDHAPPSRDRAQIPSFVISCSAWDGGLTDFPTDQPTQDLGTAKVPTPPRLWAPHQRTVCSCLLPLVSYVASSLEGSDWDLLCFHSPLLGCSTLFLSAISS